MKLIGPHTPNEIEMLLNGTKNVASICKSQFCPSIMFNENLIAVSFQTCHGEYTDILIYRKGYEKYANQIIKTYARVYNTGKFTLTDHAKLGLAHGYSKEAVRYFLNKQKGDYRNE